MGSKKLENCNGERNMTDIQLATGFGIITIATATWLLYRFL